MPTTTTSVSGTLASFVAQEVESGRHASAGEIVREGLRMLADRAKKHASLEAAIQVGIEAV